VEEDTEEDLTEKVAIEVVVVTEKEVIVVVVIEKEVIEVVVTEKVDMVVEADTNVEETEKEDINLVEIEKEDINLVEIEKEATNVEETEKEDTNLEAIEKEDTIVEVVKEVIEEVTNPVNMEDPMKEDLVIVDSVVVDVDELKEVTIAEPMLVLDFHQEEEELLHQGLKLIQTNNTSHLMLIKALTSQHYSFLAFWTCQ